MDFKPGDIILTRAHTPLSWLIRFGQSLKLRGKYAGWSHTALIVSSAGDLIEAHGNGIKNAHISEYQHKGTRFIHVPIMMNDEDRKRVLEFAERKLGEKYAFLTFASLVFNIFTPSRFIFALDNTEICSTFVAHALERAGYIWPHSTLAIVPADLAEYFKVDPSAK